MARKIYSDTVIDLSILPSCSNMLMVEAYDDGEVTIQAVDDGICICYGISIQVLEKIVQLYNYNKNVSKG